MSEQPHPTLTADYINAFPDGTRDNSSYQDIEDALDRAGAPCQGPDGKWLTLPERVTALVADVCPHCGINRVRAERAADF